MFNAKTKKELKFKSVEEDLLILFSEMIKVSISKEVFISLEEKTNDTIDLILDLKTCELIVSNKNQNKFKNPNFVKILSAEVDEVIHRQNNKNSFVIDKLKLSNLINLQFSAIGKDEIINKIIIFLQSISNKEYGLRIKLGEVKVRDNFFCELSKNKILLEYFFNFFKKEVFEWSEKFANADSFQYQLIADFTNFILKDLLLTLSKEEVLGLISEVIKIKKKEPKQNFYYWYKLNNFIDNNLSEIVTEDWLLYQMEGLQFNWSSFLIDFIPENKSNEYLDSVNGFKNKLVKFLKKGIVFVSKENKLSTRSDVLYHKEKFSEFLNLLELLPENYKFFINLKDEFGLTPSFGKEEEESLKNLLLLKDFQQSNKIIFENLDDAISILEMKKKYFS
ncbi:MAG: hypothetical protein HXM94_00110 [Parvimonas micra]|uniref:Uncharacterized protein n=1 Tax=Parvimonas micra TaxID=33033 RepID=A0A930DZI4_9FIRM|nr:hypothetical protein [Parvimonas micra]MBF1306192.1 hypothetical protein [Parvimonas micra]